MTVANGAFGKSAEGAFVESTEGARTVAGESEGCEFSGTFVGEIISPLNGEYSNVIFVDDVPTGGRTIVLTLVGADTWNDPLSDPDKLAIFNGINATTDLAASLAALSDPVKQGAVARTSDKVVTITMPAMSYSRVGELGGQGAVVIDSATITVPSSSISGPTDILAVRGFSGAAGGTTLSVVAPIGLTGLTVFAAGSVSSFATCYGNYTQITIIRRSGGGFTNAANIHFGGWLAADASHHTYYTGVTWTDGGQNITFPGLNTACPGDALFLGSGIAGKPQNSSEVIMNGIIMTGGVSCKGNVHPSL